MKRFLYLSFAAPIVAAILRCRVQGVDQQPAKPVAAFQIRANDFKADLIDACSPQQDVGPDSGAHADVDFQVCFATDAKAVLFGSHAAPQA